MSIIVIISVCKCSLSVFISSIYSCVFFICIIEIRICISALSRKILIPYLRAVGLASIEQIAHLATLKLCGGLGLCQDRPFIATYTASGCAAKVVAVGYCAAVSSAHAANTSINDVFNNIATDYASVVAAGYCAATICGYIYSIISAHAANILIAAYRAGVVAAGYRAAIILSAHATDPFFAAEIRINNTYILYCAAITCEQTDI